MSTSVFAHGQLYVALTRVGSPNKMTIFIGHKKGQPVTETENVVSKVAIQELKNLVKSAKSVKLEIAEDLPKDFSDSESMESIKDLINEMSIDKVHKTTDNKDKNLPIKIVSQKLSESHSSPSNNDYLNLSSFSTNTQEQSEINNSINNQLSNIDLNNVTQLLKTLSQVSTKLSSKP